MRLQCVINHRKIIFSCEQPRSLISFVLIDFRAFQKRGECRLNTSYWSEGKWPCIHSDCGSQARRAGEITSFKGLGGLAAAEPLAVREHGLSRCNTYTNERLATYTPAYAGVRSLLLSVINLLCSCSHSVPLHPQGALSWQPIPRRWVIFHARWHKECIMNASRPLAPFAHELPVTPDATSKLELP